MYNNQTELVPIYKGPKSSLLSWNGTCPESPDQKNVVYTLMEGPAEEKKETVSGKLCVCDINFKNHREIFDLNFYCRGFNHNGSKVSWIDEKRIVFRHNNENNPVLEDIYILNIKTKEILFGPITGSDNTSEDSVSNLPCKKIYLNLSYFSW